MACIYMQWINFKDRRTFNLHWAEKILKDDIPKFLAEHDIEASKSDDVRQAQKNHHDKLRRVAALLSKFFKHHSHKASHFQNCILKEVGIYSKDVISNYARDKSNKSCNVIATQLAILIAAAHYIQRNNRRTQERYVKFSKIVVLLTAGVPAGLVGGPVLGVVNAGAQAATEKGVEDIMKSLIPVDTNGLAREDVDIINFLMQTAASFKQDPEVHTWILTFVLLFSSRLEMLLRDVPNV